MTVSRRIPSELYDSLERRDVMRHAYYRVLAEIDSDYVRDAATLPDRMQITSAAVRKALRPFERTLPVHEREHKILANDKIVQALWKVVTREAQEVALVFAARWAFPAWSSSDAVEAVLLSQAGLGDGPASMLPAVAEVRRRTRATRHRSPTDDVSGAEIRIDAPPLRFTYLPYKMSPKAARARRETFLDAVRDDAERQLRDAEESFVQRGYRPLHPKRQSPEQLALGARVRYHRLAREEPWPWSKIAALEGRDENTVRDIFNRWYAEIGLSGNRSREDDDLPV